MVTALVVRFYESAARRSQPLEFLATLSPRDRAAIYEDLCRKGGQAAGIDAARARMARLEE